MEPLSEGEMKFIRRSLLCGIRLDGRGNAEERDFSYVEYSLPMADRAIKCVLGNTAVIVSILFKTTPATVQALNGSLTAAEEALDGRDVQFRFPEQQWATRLSTLSFLNNLGDRSSAETSATSGDNCQESKYLIFKQIEQFLAEYSIGVTIEVHMLEDDGNLFDIFFRAMTVLFSDIRIPNVKNLSDELIAGIDLPISETYTVLENSLIRDPTLKEERATDGLVHILRKEGHIVSLLVEGHVPYDLLKSVC